MPGQQNQTLLNAFTKGVNTDFSEDTTSNDTLVDAHNIKLTNYKDKTGVVQKQESYVEVVGGYDTGLKPLAVAEYDDVLYFVSLRSADNRVEIGSYPSLDVSNIYNSQGVFQSVAEIEYIAPTISDYTLGTGAHPGALMQLASTSYHSYILEDIDYYVNDDMPLGVTSSLPTSISAGGSTMLGIIPTTTTEPGASAVVTAVPKRLRVVVNEGDPELVFSLTPAAAGDGGTIGLPADTRGGLVVAGVRGSGSSYGVMEAYITEANSDYALLTSIDQSNDTLHLYSVVKESPTSSTGYTAGADFSITQGGTQNLTFYGQVSFTVDVTLDNGSLKFRNVHINKDDVKVVEFSDYEFTPGYCEYGDYISTIIATDFVYSDTETGGEQTKLLTVEIDENVQAIDRRLRVTFDSDITGLSAIEVANAAHELHYGLSADVVYIKTTNAVFDSTISLILTDETTPTATVEGVVVEWVDDSTTLNPNYGPLYNYQEPGSTNEYFLDPFRAKSDEDGFDYDENTKVDIEIQPSYDGSVNIILAAEDTKPRIINSRQKISNGQGELIIRSGDNFDNVYSDETIDKTLLIPTLGDMVPQLQFDGVKNNGKLKNGGYKYYFKLRTSDGFESDVVEESRLVSIHKGSTFGNANTLLDHSETDKSVEFTLTRLTNKTYKYVSVYYSRATGSTELTTKELFKIHADYEIIGTECRIVHTGYEPVEAVTEDVITAQLTPILSAKTLTQKNNRLLLGNIKTKKIIDPDLAKAALMCYVPQQPKKLFTVKQPTPNNQTGADDSYANADNIYNYTSYFPEETYEFAINFMFDDGFVSYAYPIMGFDYLSGNDFEPGLLGSDVGWLSSSQNSDGVVRMYKSDLADIQVDYTSGSLEVVTMTMNTTSMVSQMGDILKGKGVTGYFISRRKRDEDMLMQGLLTNTATVPTQSFSMLRTSLIMSPSYLGYGTEGSISGNYVHFPTPTNAMPFSTESLLGKDSGTGDGEIPVESGFFFDGVLYAPLPETSDKFALFSPDITSDTARAASIDAADNFSMRYITTLKASIISKPYNSVVVTSGNSTVLPYIAYSTATAYNSGLPSSLSVERVSFIGDAFRGYSAGGFTGVLDRQAVFSTYAALRPANSFPDSEDLNIITRANELTYFSNLLTNLNSQESGSKYVSGSKYEWDNAYGVAGSADKREKDVEFVQLLMTGVSYSPYLGISASDPGELSSSLNSIDNSVFTIYGTDANNRPPTSDVILGGLYSVYTNSYGGPIPTTQWADRYKIERSGSYFAISPRFKIDEAISYNDSSPNSEASQNSLLRGGDCYTGFYFQRVWKPAGIAGVPTASNPVAYAYDSERPVRDGVKITGSGYAVGFPVRSKYNFAIRALIEYNQDIASNAELATEEALYNKGRTYCPSNPKEEDILGNRQQETSMINYGNVVDESIIKQTKIDKNIPYAKVSYPNRIVVSEVSVFGEFENGYRNFKGLNAKDYNEELGDLTVIVSGNQFVYLVFTGGVSIIEVDERTMISGENQSNIYIDAAKVLPPKGKVVLSTIGAQHLHAVVSTEGAVFGLDAALAKAWSLEGGAKNVISDFRFTSKLKDIMSTDGLKNVLATYNDKKYLTSFSFFFEDQTKDVAVVYDVANKLWDGTSDVVKYFDGNVVDKPLSLIPVESSTYLCEQKEGAHERLMATDIEYPNIDPVPSSAILLETSTIPMPSYIEYVVRYEGLAKFIMTIATLNGEAVPTRVDIFPETSPQYTLTTTVKDVQGKTSEFVPVQTPTYITDPEDPDHKSMILDDYTIKRVVLPGRKPVDVGDAIEVSYNTIAGWVNLNVRVADLTVVYDTGEGLYIEYITMSHKITKLDVIDDIVKVKVGWRMPLRTAVGKIDTGKTYVNFPTKRISRLLRKAPVETKPDYVAGDNAKPYGKWVRVRMYFDGLDPIYINSIETKTTLRY